MVQPKRSRSSAAVIPPISAKSPCMALMMRVPRKMEASPSPTRPYTNPLVRPDRTDCSKRFAVIARMCVPGYGRRCARVRTRPAAAAWLFAGLELKPRVRSLYQLRIGVAVQFDASHVGCGEVVLRYHAAIAVGANCRGDGLVSGIRTCFLQRLRQYLRRVPSRRVIRLRQRTFFLVEKIHEFFLVCQRVFGNDELRERDVVGEFAHAFHVFI